MSRRWYYTVFRLLRVILVMMLRFVVKGHCLGIHMMLGIEQMALACKACASLFWSIFMVLPLYLFPYIR